MPRRNFEDEDWELWDQFKETRQRRAWVGEHLWKTAKWLLTASPGLFALLEIAQVLQRIMHP